MKIQMKRAYELPENHDGARLRDRVEEGPVTFVFAAKDEEHNTALVLKEFLEGKS